MGGFADNIRPFVEAELRAAAGNSQQEFAHLERAHVSAVRPMPLAPDLAAIIERARAGRKL